MSGRHSQTSREESDPRPFPGGLESSYIIADISPGYRCCALLPNNDELVVETGLVDLALVVLATRTPNFRSIEQGLSLIDY